MMSRMSAEFKSKSWQVSHDIRNMVYYLRTDPFNGGIFGYRLAMVNETQTTEFVYDETELILLRDLLNYAFPVEDVANEREKHE